MHWSKQLAYTITPKSGPMRGMETLLDANRAISEDLPAGSLKRYHWLAAGKLLVHAAETGRSADIKRATHELLNAVQREGWMNRGRSTPVMLQSPNRRSSTGPVGEAGVFAQRGRLRQQSN